MGLEIVKLIENIVDSLTNGNERWIGEEKDSDRTDRIKSLFFDLAIKFGCESHQKKSSSKEEWMTLDAVWYERHDTLEFHRYGDIALAMESENVSSNVKYSVDKLADIIAKIKLCIFWVPNEEEFEQVQKDIFQVLSLHKIHQSPLAEYVFIAIMEIPQTLGVFILNKDWELKSFQKYAFG